ncbi:MAG TPA: TraB/GumN family protein [Gillisia sp.]|nr:TraB/GumN family protein [Gillisia sp.]
MIEKNYRFPEWKKEKKIIRFWVNKITETGLDKGDCSFTKKYREFDLDYEFSESCPEDILVKKRNEDWMNIIPEYLKTTNCFIAVGYQHLKNKCGLLEQLKKNGFILEPIEIKAIR